MDSGKNMANGVIAPIGPGAGYGRSDRLATIGVPIDLEGPVIPARLRCQKPAYSLERR